MGRTAVSVACIILQITYAVGQLQPFCEDPADRGPCNKLELRYRFNEDNEYCDTFLYGGCGGNKNNFRTVGECVKACVDEPKGSICELPPDAGSCFHATLPRYYYNEETESCKIFYFSGCQGNENNFVSGEDCKRKCKALSIEPLPAGNNQGSGYQWNDPGSSPNTGNSWISPAPTQSVNWNNPRPTNVVNRGWGNHYNDQSNHNAPPPPQPPPRNDPPPSRHAPPAQYDFNSQPHSNNNHPPPNYNNNHNSPPSYHNNNNNHHHHHYPNYNPNPNSNPNHYHNNHSPQSAPLNGNSGKSITFVENDPHNQKPNPPAPKIQPPEMREYNGNSPWNSSGWNGNSGWNRNPHHNSNIGSSGESSWRSNESRNQQNPDNNSNNGWNNPGSEGNNGGGGGSSWNHSMSFKRRVGAHDNTRHSNDPSNGSPWNSPSNGGNNRHGGPMSPMAHLNRRFGHNPFGSPPRTTTPEDDIITTPETPASTTPPYNYNYNHGPAPSNNDNHDHLYNWDSPPHQPPTKHPPYSPPQQSQPFPPKKNNHIPTNQNNPVPSNPPPPEPSYNYNKNQQGPPRKASSRRRFAPDWAQQQEVPSSNQMAYPPTTTPMPPPPPAPANNLPSQNSWDNIFRRKKDPPPQPQKSVPTEIASYDFEAGSPAKTSSTPIHNPVEHSHGNAQQTQSTKQEPQAYRTSPPEAFHQYDFEAGVNKHQEIPAKSRPPRKNGETTASNSPNQGVERFPTSKTSNQYDFQSNPIAAQGGKPDVRSSENTISRDDFRRQNAMRMFNKRIQFGDADAGIGSAFKHTEPVQTTNAPQKTLMSISSATYDDNQTPASHMQVTGHDHLHDDKTSSPFDSFMKPKTSNQPDPKANSGLSKFDSFLRPKGRHAPSSFQSQSEHGVQSNKPLAPPSNNEYQQPPKRHGHGDNTNADFDRFLKPKHSNEQSPDKTNVNNPGTNFDNFLPRKTSANNFDSFLDSKKSNNVEQQRPHGHSGQAPMNDSPPNSNTQNSFDSFRRQNKWHSNQHTAEFNSLPDRKHSINHVQDSNIKSSFSSLNQGGGYKEYQNSPHGSRLQNAAQSNQQDADPYRRKEAFDLSGTHTAPTEAPSKHASVLSGADLSGAVSPSLGQGHALSTGKPGFGISPASEPNIMDSSASNPNTEPFSLTGSTPRHSSYQSEPTNNNNQRNSHHAGSSTNIFEPTKAPSTHYNDPINQEPLSVTVNDSSKLKEIFGQTMPSTKVPIGLILTHKPFTDNFDMQTKFPLLYERFIQALKSGKIDAKDFLPTVVGSEENQQHPNNQPATNTNSQITTKSDSTIKSDSGSHHDKFSTHSTNHPANELYITPQPNQNTQEQQYPQQQQQQTYQQQHQTHQQHQHWQHRGHPRPSHGHQQSWEQNPQQQKQEQSSNQQQTHQQENTNGLQHQQLQSSIQSLHERRQRFMEQSRNQHTSSGSNRQSFNQLYQTTTMPPTEATTQAYFRNTYPTIFNMLVKNSLPPTQTPKPETTRIQAHNFQQHQSQHTANKFSQLSNPRQEPNSGSYVPESSLRLGGPSFSSVHENAPIGNHLLDVVPEMQLYETREPILPIDMISENKTKTENVNIGHSHNILMDKDERQSMKFSSIDPYYSKDIPSGTRIEKISTLRPSQVETTYSRAPTIPTTLPPITESVSTKRQTPISHHHLPTNRRHEQSRFESSFGRFGNSHQQFRSQMGLASHSDSKAQVEQTVVNSNQQNHFDRQTEQYNQGHGHSNPQMLHKKTHVTVTIKTTQPPASTVLGIHQQKHSFVTKAPNNHPIKDPTSVKDIIPEQQSQQNHFRNFQTGSHNQQNHQLQQTSHAGFAISSVEHKSAGSASNQIHRSLQNTQASNAEHQSRLGQTIDRVSSSAAFSQQHRQLNRHSMHHNRQNLQLQATNQHEKQSSTIRGGHSQIHSNRNTVHRQQIPQAPKVESSSDPGFFISDPKDTIPSPASQQHHSAGIHSRIQSHGSRAVQSPTPAPTQGYLNFMADFGGIENFALSHSSHGQGKNSVNSPRSVMAQSATSGRTNNQPSAQNSQINNSKNTAPQTAAMWGRRQQFSNRFQRQQGFGGSFQQNQMNFQARSTTSTTTTTTTTTTTAAPPVRRHFTAHHVSPQAQQQVSVSSQNRCRMPKEEGPCRNWASRYFYDPIMMNCREFYFGGCGGNQNNFRSRSDCLRTCYGS